MLRKLTRAQMNAYKLKGMRAPGACCPLCLKSFSSMESKNVVVDHDHDTGRIRGLLCRGCNGAEGKVANSAGRWAGLGMNYDKIVPWLEKLVLYLKSTPTDMVYPTHLTEEEKKKAAGDKRRLEAQKKAKARAAAIKEKRAAR
ncbi:recombination endonuclease VII [Aeromonas phage Atoyac15]|uniref:Recombination endonuclease VII n=1 Tax=Aeromonas phage Atoyac15 TaxID=2767551 RepID=A0A866D1T2_9CAUD|nr:recombination endonuclease VII [Aeromonas phage Atoyac15]